MAWYFDIPLLFLFHPRDLIFHPHNNARQHNSYHRLPQEYVDDLGTSNVRIPDEVLLENDQIFRIPQSSRCFLTTLSITNHHLTPSGVFDTLSGTYPREYGFVLDIESTVFSHLGVNDLIYISLPYDATKEIFLETFGCSFNFDIKYACLEINVIDENIQYHAGATVEYCFATQTIDILFRNDLRFPFLCRCPSRSFSSRSQ